MREIVEIQQDLNGKWFCYFEETREYTPGFAERKDLVNYLEKFRGVIVEEGD